MSLSTNENKLKDNRQKIADLRKKHQPLLDKLEVPEAVFIPKLAYRPKTESGNQLEDQHLAFFPSELGKGTDIYTEFASHDYEPQDPERKLYKLRHNPHWESEYAKTERHPVSGYRYLVPVAELIEVTADLEQETLSKEFAIPDPDTDLPLTQCTLRDLYAVLHNVPVSNKVWLNKIIQQSQKK